jgi:hypothetical protein
MRQARRWYQLSIRDSFLFGGFIVGWATYELIQTHVHPRPHFLEFLPIAVAVLGAGIGELVKRKRAGNALKTPRPEAHS